MVRDPAIQANAPLSAWIDTPGVLGMSRRIIHALTVADRQYRELRRMKELDIDRLKDLGMTRSELERSVCSPGHDRNKAPAAICTGASF